MKQNPKKGPSRAQLQRVIARLEEKNRALSKLLKGDGLRQKGEHWYELLEFFDARKIERLPIPGAPERTFFMGMLEHSFVIQVPKDESPESISAFIELLKSRGLTAPVLVITEGVRFLKLAVVPEEIEQKLDAVELGKDDDDGEEGSEQVPSLSEEEGRSEASEVPEVPGSAGEEEDTGRADSEPYASRR